MRWISGAAVSGAVAVGLSAFGAHGLKGRVSERMLAAWGTGATYHLTHSVLMLVVCSLPGKVAARERSLRLFASGITLFSGSLYAMVLTDNTKLGAVTPIGGLILIGAWLSLALLER